MFFKSLPENWDRENDVWTELEKNNFAIPAVGAVTELPGQVALKFQGPGMELQPMQCWLVAVV